MLAIVMIVYRPHVRCLSNRGVYIPASYRSSFEGSRLKSNRRGDGVRRNEATIFRTLLEITRDALYRDIGNVCSLRRRFWDQCIWAVAGDWIHWGVVWRIHRRFICYEIDNGDVSGRCIIKGVDGKVEFDNTWTICDEDIIQKKILHTFLLAIFHGSIEFKIRCVFKFWSRLLCPWARHVTLIASLYQGE